MKIFKNKKVLIILILLFILGFGFGIYLATKPHKTDGKVDYEIVTDGASFKTEYESLNGQTKEGADHEYRTVNLTDKNPIHYQTMAEIVKKFEDKESFIVYFGFPGCPWCRSMVETLVETLNEEKVESIYYVNVRPIDAKENDFRGYKKVDENGNVVDEVQASMSYETLLTYLDNVLEDYELEDANGKKVSAGVKRLYAPTIVVVNKGKAVFATDGISEDQTDAFAELTDKMKEDMKEEIKEAIDKFKGE